MKKTIALKTIVALMLSLVFVFSMVACGGRGSGGNGGGNGSGTGGNGGGNGGGSGGSQSEEFGPIGDDVYVSIVDAGLGKEWMDKIAAGYYEETGITVKVIADPELVTNVGTKMGSANSEKSDLYFVPQAGNAWITYAARGQMEPLDDVLASSRWGIPAKDRIRDNTALKMGQYLDETSLTVPYIYSCWGFVYNEDLLNKFESYGEYEKGVFPATVQGLFDLCTAVTNAKMMNNRTNRVISPYSVGLNVGYMNYLFFSLWHQLDPDGFQAYYDQNDKSEFNGSLLKTESSIRSAETIFDLIGAKSESESNMVSNSQNHLESQASFVNGDCVFTFSGSWFATEEKKIMDEVGMKNIRFAPYPVYEKGNKSSLNVNYPGENFFIPSDAINKAGAKDFLAYVMSEAGVSIMEKTLSVSSLFTTSEDIELTTFGQDLEDAIQASNIFYTWSPNMVYKSGALGLFKMPNSPFTSMAKCKIKNKSEIPSKMFDEEIKEHQLRWKDYIVLIPEGY